MSRILIIVIVPFIVVACMDTHRLALDDTETSFKASLEVFQIAAGGAHTCALLESGGVRCWGRGDRLGYGNTESIGDDETLVGLGDVELGEGAVQLSAGGDFTGATLSSGSIRLWGRNDFGQLGQGNTEPIGDDELPTAVAPGVAPDSIMEIVAGAQHVCVLLANREIRCWGRGSEQQLGYGNNESIGDDEMINTVPSVTTQEPGIQMLSLGRHHTCVVFDSLFHECWGHGFFGQLGLLSDVNLGPSAIAAGAHHTCAIVEAGQVKCWGRGSEGQLGYGDADHRGDNEAITSYGQVDLGGRAVQLVAGELHTCVLLDTREVKCWGRGSEGQLGYGNLQSLGDESGETPIELGVVPLGAPATQITAGDRHTCALLDNNGVRCWGLGVDGRLGTGNTDNVGDDEVPSDVEPIFFYP